MVRGEIGEARFIQRNTLFHPKTVLPGLWSETSIYLTPSDSNNLTFPSLLINRFQNLGSRVDFFLFFLFLPRQSFPFCHLDTRRRLDIYLPSTVRVLLLLG